MQEKRDTWVWFLRQEDPLKEEMATHSSILVTSSWTWLSDWVCAHTRMYAHNAWISHWMWNQKAVRSCFSPVLYWKSQLWKIYLEGIFLTTERFLKMKHLWFWEVKLSWTRTGEGNSVEFQVIWLLWLSKKISNSYFIHLFSVPLNKHWTML